MSLRSFNCPHTKSGHKGARNLSYKPNNVSFVCGNLVGGRERSCNNRLYFHSSFMLCFTELFIYVTDFILLATESFFSFKNITPLAKVHTVFKWKNQDSLPGTQTLIHSQSPNFMLSQCRRCSVICLAKCFFPLSRLVKGGAERLPMSGRKLPAPTLASPGNQRLFLQKDARRDSVTQGYPSYSLRAQGK